MTSGSDDAARVLRLPTGETITVPRSARDGGTVFEVDALLPPRLAGPPRHRHRWQTETFTVLEGRLRVRVGTDALVLSAGETATVPPTVVHAFANPFDEPARIRMQENPAGPLEEQFRALARGGHLPPLGELPAINVRHDLSFAVHGVPDLVQRPLRQALGWAHGRRRR